MEGLTTTQQNVLDFIRGFRRQYGKSPTAREIQKFLGIRSPNGATCHVKALIKKGVVRRDRHQARSIIPVDEEDVRDEVIRTLLAACQAAKEFIKNGVEFGCIKMPDTPTDDAHKTLPRIEAAIGLAKDLGFSVDSAGGVW